MKKLTKENIFNIVYTGCMILLAVLFTIAVERIDTSIVWGKEIGFSKINIAVHQFLQTSKFFDILSSVTMVVSFLLMGGLVFVGVYQLLSTKKFKAVDKSLWLAGAVIALTFVVYSFFELVVINFRPVLVDGFLEASYPSTHILFSVVINILAIDYVSFKITNKKIKLPVVISIWVITAVGVISRVISGMHWLTDIIGGLIFSGALVMIYYTLKGIFVKKEEQSIEVAVEDKPLESVENISEENK